MYYSSIELCVEMCLNISRTASYHKKIFFGDSHDGYYTYCYPEKRKKGKKKKQNKYIIKIIATVISLIHVILV